MFRDLTAALEKIHFQPDSPLFSHLTDLFSDAIVQIDQAVGASSKSPKDLYACVHRTIEEMKFFSHIAQIVKADTGMTLTSGDIEDDPDPNAGILRSLHIIDPDTLIPDKPGKKKLPPLTTLAQCQTLVAEFVSNIDQTSGTVRKNIDRYYTARLSITTGFFLIPHLYPTMVGLTAREMAASVLHELGHMFGDLDLYCRAFERAVHIRDLIDALDTVTPHMETTKLLLEAISKEIPRISDASSQRVLQEIMIRVTQKTSTDLDLTLDLYLVCLVIFVRAGSAYTNDILSTKLTTIHFERIADEWAAKHGASADLISAWAKMTHPSFKSSSQPTHRLLSAVSLIDLFSITSQMIKNLKLYRLLTLDTEYDRPIRRFTLLIQDTMEELSKTDLPPKLRDALIAIVRRGRSEIDAFKSENYVRRGEIFWSTLLRIARPFGGRDGTLAADCQRLQEFTGDLLRNPFTYHAARLQILKDKASEIDGPMDRATLIRRLKTEFTSSELQHITVGAGAALVIYGAKAIAADIDCSVDSQAALKDMASRRGLSLSKSIMNDAQRLGIGEWAELFYDPDLEKEYLVDGQKHRVLIEGIWVETPEALVGWYVLMARRRNLPKDHANLARARKLLKQF